MGSIRTYVETQDFASLRASVQHTLRRFIKFIFLPIGGIRNDVITNISKRFFIANNMIVKSRLPGKFRVYLTCIFGHANFKTTDDGCQIFGLWTKSVLWWIGFGVRDGCVVVDWVGYIDWFIDDDNAMNVVGHHDI